MAGEKKVFETKQESLEDYKKYIKEHIDAVIKAFDLFGVKLTEYVCTHRDDGRHEDSTVVYNTLSNIISTHDHTKYGIEEFEAYRAKWHPCKEDLENPFQVRENFEAAWKHHYSHNFHHPEYWVVNSNGKTIIMRMSKVAFIEMLCDWIAMSMVRNQNVADWWNSPGGKKEKSEIMDDQDVKLIDEILHRYKRDFDFTIKEA